VRARDLEMPIILLHRQGQEEVLRRRLPNLGGVRHTGHSVTKPSAHDGRVSLRALAVLRPGIKSHTPRAITAVRSSGLGSTCGAHKLLRHGAKWCYTRQEFALALTISSPIRPERSRSHSRRDHGPSCGLA